MAYDADGGRIRRPTWSTLLGGLRPPPTCRNAGPHSGGREIHGKDGVARFDSGGGSTPNQQLRPGRDARPVASPRAAGRRLPEVCQLDLYALRRGGTCRCGTAITGGHWIGGGWSASVSPHHSSAGADDHGVPRDLPEQAVARRWCEARHEEDIGYRSAPGGIDADPTPSEEGTAPSVLSLRLGPGLQSWPVTSEMGP